MGNWLVIKFVSKTDSQIQKLLQNEEDVSLHYTGGHFGRIFGNYFNIREKVKSPDLERLRDLMEKGGQIIHMWHGICFYQGK
jgi:hypothetical protein